MGVSLVIVEKQLVKVAICLNIVCWVLHFPVVIKMGPMQNASLVGKLRRVINMEGVNYILVIENPEGV